MKTTDGTQTSNSAILFMGIAVAILGTFLSLSLLFLSVAVYVKIQVKIDELNHVAGGRVGKSSIKVFQYSLCLPQNIEVVSVPVEIEFGYYNDYLDYLEWGETAEYAQKADVTFTYSVDGLLYSESELLLPPNYRALKVLYAENKDVYINLIFCGDSFTSIHQIESSSGNKLWDFDSYSAPRDLSTLEKWVIRSYSGLSSESRGVLFSRWFDKMPLVTELYQGGLYAPSEVVARRTAYLSYVSANPVWEEVSCNSDVFNSDLVVKHRWVDQASGQVLKIVDIDAGLLELPKSGWAALEVGILQEEGNLLLAPTSWKRTLTIEVSQGFVIGVDRGGYICNSGKLTQVLSDDEIAAFTSGWSTEFILSLLPDKVDETDLNLELSMSE